jgi:hypothetical protein
LKVRRLKVVMCEGEVESRKWKIMLKVPECEGEFRKYKVEDGG